MVFDQETVDRIRIALPIKMRKELAEELEIPYTSVCDALNVYRELKGKRKRNKKEKIYLLAVEKLKGRGVTIE